MNIRPAYLVAGLSAAAVVGLLIYSRRSSGNVGKDIGAGAVGLADNIFAGAVEGIGSLVGVPATNPDQCAADQVAGRTWDASFSCPAGDFLGYLFKPSKAADYVPTPSPVAYVGQDDGYAGLR